MANILTDPNTFDRVTLENERTRTSKMFLMKIIKCTNQGAKDHVHNQANPFVARSLVKLLRQAIKTHAGDAANLNADAISDTGTR